MESFVRQQNIKLLEKALERESNPEQRRVLERLLAEQVAKATAVNELEMRLPC